MNTFGKIYTLTSFGESHGPAIGGVIDGMPAGLKVDFDKISLEMARRRPGQSKLTTQRNEPDEVEFLSGFKNGITLGTPIGFVIPNVNQHSADYDALEDVYRPNHADYTYEAKYGIRQSAGGGRASARATASFVVAGSLAKQALEFKGVHVYANVVEVGGVTGTIQEMENAIAKAKSTCDSLGGIIECRVTGLPPGIGEPVGGKLNAMLAHAMLSINAVKGFEYGDGFESARHTGSEQADEFFKGADGSVRTRTNHSGGIQGGISNGNDVTFKVAFKPVPTISQPLRTINRAGEELVLEAKGRHDPCVVFRALPIVEAMAAMVLFDAILLNRCSKI